MSTMIFLSVPNIYSTLLTKYLSVSSHPLLCYTHHCLGGEVEGAADIERLERMFT